MAGSGREAWIGLPGGEAATSPVEGTTVGKLVSPYFVEHREIGHPQEPMELTIREGNVVEVSGGVEAQRLKALLAKSGPSARNIAELAIGTNRRCRLEAGHREAKRVWGTTHIALGDNRSVGGSVESPIHIDFILTESTVWLDGKEVVRGESCLMFSVSLKVVETSCFALSSAWITWEKRVGHSKGPNSIGEKAIGGES